MFEVAEKTDGVLNKMRVFLDRGPEYNWMISVYRPDLKPVADGELPRIRYNSTLQNTPMALYGLINGILVILETSWALGEPFHLHEDLKLAGIGAENVWFCHLIFSYFSFMSLFDLKWYATPLELVRSISFAWLIGWYAGNSINPYVWNLVLVHATISICTLLFFYGKEVKQKSSSKKHH